MKEITAKESIERDGKYFVVITYDDGSKEEIPREDDPFNSSKERWEEICSQAPGFDDKGNPAKKEDVDVLRKLLYG